MNITVNKVKQYMKSRIHIISVDGTPQFAVRSAKAVERIIARLKGEDVKLEDKIIEQICDRIREEK